MPGFGSIAGAPVGAEESGAVGSATVFADLIAAYGLSSLVSADLGCTYAIGAASSSTVAADLTASYLIVASNLGLTLKTIIVSLKKAGDLTPRANISNINWEWRDTRGAITSSGGSLSSDSMGNVSVPVMTALLSDGVGLLTLDNYNGGNSLTYFGFNGPVRVP